MNRVEANPFTRVTGPKMGKKLPTVVQGPRMDQLLDQVAFPEGFTGKRDRLILVLLYMIGLRRSELIALKPEAIDHKGLTIRVYGKGGKERIVPVSRETAGLVADYLKSKDEHYGEKAVAEELIVTDRGQ